MPFRRNSELFHCRALSLGPDLFSSESRALFNFWAVLKAENAQTRNLSIRDLGFYRQNAKQRSENHPEDRRHGAKSPVFLQNNPEPAPCVHAGVNMRTSACTRTAPAPRESSPAFPMLHLAIPRFPRLQLNDDCIKGFISPLCLWHDGPSVNSRLYRRHDMEQRCKER